MRLRLGLAGKLIAVNLAVVAVAVLLTGVLHTTMLRDYVFSHKESELVSAAEQINHVAVQYVSGEMNEEALVSVLDAVDRLVDARVSLVDIQGRILRGSRGMQAGRRAFVTPEDLQQLQGGETVVHTHKHPHFEEEMLSVAVPLMREPQQSGAVVAAVLLHSPVRGIQQTVDRLRTFTLWAGMIALLSAGALGYAAFKRIAHPISAMTEAALAMADGNFSRRVAVESDDEIGQLGRSLNHLAANLSHSIWTLRREKDKFASTVSAMTEGVLGVDRDGRVFLVNPAAARILHITPRSEAQESAEEPEKLLGDNLQEIVDETLQSGESQRGKLQLEDTVCEVHAAPVGAENAEPWWGCVVLLRDVSDEHRLEQLRRQFVADASHELRTPLTVISGFLEALHDGTVPDDEREQFVALMRDEARRLNRLVANLLDLERYDSGRIKLDFGWFDPGESMQTVSRSLQLTAAEGEVNLKVDCPNDLPRVYADREAIERILLNLVENALRHTPPGGEVTMRAHREGDRVHVQVTDTGGGIPPEEIPHLWERFYKVDRSRSRDSSGTGLGLAIVRRLIEAHGEDIWVDSEPGVGTTFTFTLKTGCC